MASVSVRIHPALAIGVASSCAPQHAHAWGAVGHRLIAEIAESKLTPAASAEVDRLLALEPRATLGSIASWADETRDPRTAPWHWVNFRRGEPCDYEAAARCIHGNCAVGAIEKQAAILASNVAGIERLKALKYLAHFIGDLHQPLHDGFSDDRGGNGYQLQAYGKGTNLHQVDSLLIQNWPGGLPALRAAVDAEATSTDTALAPENWAEQSCRIAATDGFYPATHVLEADYASRWSPTVVQRMAAAGRRLARALNVTLGGSAR